MNGIPLPSFRASDMNCSHELDASCPAVMLLTVLFYFTERACVIPSVLAIPEVAETQTREFQHRDLMMIIPLPR